MVSFLNTAPASPNVHVRQLVGNSNRSACSTAGAFHVQNTFLTGPTATHCVEQFASWFVCRRIRRKQWFACEIIVCILTKLFSGRVCRNRLFVHTQNVSVLQTPLPQYRKTQFVRVGGARGGSAQHCSLPVCGPAHKIWSFVRKSVTEAPSSQHSQDGQKSELLRLKGRLCCEVTPAASERQSDKGLTLPLRRSGNLELVSVSLFHLKSDHAKRTIKISPVDSNFCLVL